MANVWRVTTVIDGLQGAPYYSTFHFDPLSPGGVAGCLAAVGDFWEDFDAYLGPTMSCQVQNEVAVIDMDTNTQVDVEVGPTQLPFTFHGSGERVPYVLQGLIQWKTGTFINGRQLRGRTFIPGFGIGASEDGKVLGSVIAAGELAAETLATAEDVSLVVYSPTHAQFALVTDAEMWSDWAELRTRRS